MFSKKDLKKLREHLAETNQERTERDELKEDFLPIAMMGARFGMFVLFQSMYYKNILKRARQIMTERGDDVSDLSPRELMDRMKDESHEVHNEMGNWLTTQFFHDETVRKACAVISDAVEESMNGKVPDSEDFMSACLGFHERLSELSRENKMSFNTVSESIN